MESAASWTIELEAALVRELASNFAWENDARFGKRLRPPVFVLSNAATRLGQWISATRTLELSRKMVLARPWPEVIAVLQHEMAHQYVDEVLQVRDESAHGPTFQRVCSERGIDARAAGRPVAATADAQAASDAPSASPHAQTEGNRVLERIRKLLALAGSAEMHEAELAMKRAHELMLRYNIDEAAAPKNLAYEVAHLGDPTKRHTRVETEIIALLSALFFVKVIQVPVYLPTLGKRGSVFEIAGTQANLAMATHVYAFLMATAERLWLANRNDKRVRSGRDRLAYQAGVIRGFHEKLATERKSLSVVPSDSNEKALVWRGDRALDAFYRAKHPRIVRRTSRVRQNAAHAAGAEAGRTIVLHRPVGSGEGRTSNSGPRYLPGK